MFLPSWPGPKSELAHCGTSFFWPPKIVIFSKFKCLQWRSFFNWKYKKSSNLFVSCKFCQEISLVNSLYYFNHERIFSLQWGLNFWQFRNILFFSKLLTLVKIFWSNRAKIFDWQAAIQSFGLCRSFFRSKLFGGYVMYNTRRACFYPAGTIWGQKRRSQAQNHFELPWWNWKNSVHELRELLPF